MSLGKNNYTPQLESSGQSSLSNRALTIPNLISLIRILLITPFVVFFLDKEYLVATIIIVVSGISDCFDGMIARKFNQESELGKILDPLADKLTLLAVGVCIVVVEPYFLPIVVILVAKDVLMLIGSSKVVKKGIIVPKSMWYGKLGTVLFYVSVTFIVLVEVLQNAEEPIVYISKETGMVISMVLLSLTAAVMIFALIMYAKMYKGIMEKSESGDEHSASITE
ncbi:MAG: CDP-alcohol phosphatidyltransferase family protein [Ruminococcus sp.]|nr:CDP-alcohol phosphatidyltransferase family protein [Ruminococcus sp.]